jgi:signal transduction histidine kinase
VVERVLEFVGSGLRAQGIQVEARLGAGLPQLMTNFDELYEVILNLIVNAQDAMPHGGTLTLETRLEDTSVVVQVKDTGCGIPHEHLPRIFEPGFSTKYDQGIAKGLGLGLFLAQGIVESLGGSVIVDSTVGRGATFAVKLPVSAT